MFLAQIQDIFDAKKADFIDLFHVHPGELLDFNIKLNFIKQTLSTLFLSIYYARANKDFFNWIYYIKIKKINSVDKENT